MDVYGNCIRFYPVQQYRDECLSLYFHNEFKSTKGIVLARGHFNPEVLDVGSSQGLIYQFLAYYGEQDASRTEVMDNYAYDNGPFDHVKLVTQLVKYCCQDRCPDYVNTAKDEPLDQLKPSDVQEPDLGPEPDLEPDLELEDPDSEENDDSSDDYFEPEEESSSDDDSED